LCPCCMPMSILVHISVYAACTGMLHSTCPWYMSLFELHVHVHVHVACPKPCCTSMSMLHIHTQQSFNSVFVMTICCRLAPEFEKIYFPKLADSRKSIKCHREYSRLLKWAL
jgi:hypothetical protein